MIAFGATLQATLFDVRRHLMLMIVPYGNGQVASITERRGS